MENNTKSPIVILGRPDSPRIKERINELKKAGYNIEIQRDGDNAIKVIATKEQDRGNKGREDQGKER